MLKKLRNLYLCTLKATFQKSVIFSIIWEFIRHHAQLGKTSKIKELSFSESRGQCPRFSGTFNYTPLALITV